MMDEYIQYQKNQEKWVEDNHLAPATKVVVDKSKYDEKDSKGWDNTWVPNMVQGKKTLIVRSVTNGDSRGISLDDGYCYPYYCLEVVDEGNTVTGNEYEINEQKWIKEHNLKNGTTVKVDKSKYDEANPKGWNNEWTEGMSSKDDDEEMEVVNFGISEARGILLDDGYCYPYYCLEVVDSPIVAVEPEDYLGKQYKFLWDNGFSKENFHGARFYVDPRNVHLDDTNGWEGKYAPEMFHTNILVVDEFAINHLDTPYGILMTDGRYYPYFMLIRADDMPILHERTFNHMVYLTRQYHWVLKNHVKVADTVYVIPEVAEKLYRGIGFDGWANIWNDKMLTSGKLAVTKIGEDGIRCSDGFWYPFHALSTNPVELKDSTKQDSTNTTNTDDKLYTVENLKKYLDYFDENAPFLEFVKNVLKVEAMGKAN